MSRKKTIAIVSNLTSGGAVVYKEKLLQNLGGNILVFEPRPFQKNASRITNLFKYFKYLYVDLIVDYFVISRKINRNSNISKIIVFQDSYIKAPFILPILKSKTVYILHEPPREFYEPLRFHSPKMANIFFNYTVRLFVWISDYFLTKTADIIVSNSIYSQRKIKQIYGRGSVVVYPGSSLSPKKHSLKPINHKNCISVGSFLPYKGHKQTIDAISIIDTERRPKLTIVGSGSVTEKNELIEYSKEKKVETMIIQEPTDAQLEDLYKKSSVYINSAYKEPFGITSLEALLFGCNLVTVDNGGTKELIKFFPKNIYVANMDDNVQISQLIIKALNNNLHREFKTTPKELSWSKIGERILEL